MATSSRWRADTRGPGLARLLILAAVLAACGSQLPTSPSTPVGPQTACVGLEAAQCQQALAALSANLPGVTPSYVAVSERSCDGPCPGAERGAWQGHLVVEFPDGRKPDTILIAVDGVAVDWEPIETVLVQVTPRSPRLTGPTHHFTLGHCGLHSGIDVDGTFWDPIGMIDANAPDLINSAGARFTMTSPGAAHIRTEGGAVVQLARHQGPKWMFLCD